LFAYIIQQHAKKPTKCPTILVGWWIGVNKELMNERVLFTYWTQVMDPEALGCGVAMTGYDLAGIHLNK
jgi:hypothetical protein